MLPYKTLVPIHKKSGMPIYLQVTKALIQQIKEGRLAPAAKLPGSRTLAALLGIHRKTVVAAYEELDAQGWIHIVAAKGTFVTHKLPKVIPRTLTATKQYGAQKIAAQTGFTIATTQAYLKPMSRQNKLIALDDGFPDTRIAPLEALGRTYKSIVNSKYSRRYLGYSAFIKGDPNLREELAKYLLATRGIKADIDNILITRGSIMGFYLFFQTILRAGDVVIVGETNYRTAEYIVRKAQGKLLYVPVDQEGLDVDAIAEICQRRKVRAVYVASHHHHPTTVTLSAERRMKLLLLASEYRFAIIEDDYDYDYHYNSSPILPLASSDQEGFVTYVGSLSKTIAPAFRVGFVVAPQNLIEEMAKNRRYIDRQGDIILEKTIAQLFAEGEIKRHLRKSLKIYHQRRDYFCALLRNELGEYLEFDTPEGGMAVWARFAKDIALDALAESAVAQGLTFTGAHHYNPIGKNLNATRLGFASNNEKELTKAIGILKQLIQG